MLSRTKNIFAELHVASGQERSLTLFENEDVKIERVVSRSHRSPAGFWYDQDEEEWVIVLRGDATLEFADGEFVDMQAGDHLTVPSHVKHRVSRTGPETVWLAVRVKPAG